jgi:hypothetical protein
MWATGNRELSEGGKELGWAGVQEAIKFVKAQEDVEVCLLAMHVFGYLIRTELTIQHEQD